MRMPTLLKDSDRRRLVELDALITALDMPASDHVLMIFSHAYADACQAYEKKMGATAPITFTVAKEPMQTALAKVNRSYRDLAATIARHA